jgi:hypothetical protein
MLVVLLDCAEQRVSLSLPATARILWQVAGDIERGSRQIRYLFSAGTFYDKCLLRYCCSWR